MIDDAMEAGVEDLAGGVAAAFSYDVAKGVKASAAQAGKGEWSCVLSCLWQQGAAQSCGKGRAARRSLASECAVRVAGRVTSTVSGCSLLQVVQRTLCKAVDLGPLLFFQLLSATGLGPRSPAYMTAQTLEAMIDTIGDFFKRQPTGGKCHNCGAHNPTIKR